MNDGLALAILLALAVIVPALTFVRRRRLEQQWADGGAGLDFDPAPVRWQGWGGAAPAPVPALPDRVPELRATLGKLAAYDVPIGYQIDGRGYNLISAGLVGDTTHLLITGASGCGKDTLAATMLLSLAIRNAGGVDLCIIDGKGLDFVAWQHKAPVWRAAIEPEEIAATLEAITAERQRRGQLLRAAGVAKWEDYRAGDLPLLIVYVSELSLLIDALGSSSKLDQWLNSELAAGRAFGIRYIVASQTVANFATRWRSQIGLYVAGYQPNASQDEPNTGMTARGIAEAGGIAPSELPDPPRGAGLFTACQGRQVATVRAVHLTPQQLAWGLAQLPARQLDLPRYTDGGSTSIDMAGGAVDVVNTGNTDTNTGAGTDPLDTPKRRRRIAEALQAGLSSSAIAELIGGNRNKVFDLIKAVRGELDNEQG